MEKLLTVLLVSFAARFVVQKVLDILNHLFAAKFANLGTKRTVLGIASALIGIGLCTTEHIEIFSVLHAGTRDRPPRLRPALCSPSSITLLAAFMSVPARTALTL